MTMGTLETDTPGGVGEEDKEETWRKPDFPEFLGAMMVKELRQGMRARLFVLPFVLVHVFAIIALMFHYSDFQKGLVYSSSSSGGGFSGMGEPIWIVIYVLMWCFLPLGALGLLQQEASGRNVELLLLTRLSRWKIVIGKWLMMCALGILTFVSLVPYILVRYFLGPMDVGDALLFVFHLVLLNAVLNAIVLGASGYKNYAMRILIGLITIGSLFFSMLVPMIVTLSPFGSAGREWIWIPSMLAASALYILFGLQLGRGRLRLFEHPYEPPPSRVVVALICCAPIFIAIVSAVTGGYAGFAGMGVLIWFVLLIDRKPKQLLAPRPG